MAEKHVTRAPRRPAVLNDKSHAEAINRMLLQADAILGRFIEAIADPADDDRCVFGTVRDLMAWAVALDAAGGGAPKHVEIAQAVLSRNLDATPSQRASRATSCASSSGCCAGRAGCCLTRH
jgi:hypothetical protein